MNTQINRKAFLQVTLATTLAGIVGCSGEEMEGGDGDGDFGTGGGTPGTGGAGTGGAGTGGAATGGAGTGGDAATGGAATGGDSATGGASTGGDAATGGAGTGGDGGGLMCTEDIMITSSGGHTHTLLLTAAQLNAGAAVQIISGETLSHDHMIDFTAEDIATIKAGGVVKKFSCDGGDHEYVISCAPSAPQPIAPNGEGWLVDFCPMP